MSTLNNLPLGHTATVVAVGGEGSLRQHFLDMGIIPQVDVTMVKHAPMGDPVEVRVHGYELTLRLDDARRIEVEDERAVADGRGGTRMRRLFDEQKPLPHPGLGEGGRFHDKADEHPLPEGEPVTFALVGNQNCGKTTLFNQLTGSSQHVGNFPGVTVDRKDGLHPRPCGSAGHGPAGHLLHVAILQRGGGHAARFCWKGTRAASSTSWTPRTWSATCI